MNIRFSDSAKKDFKDLPDDIKARARKQLHLLQADLRHPSIRATQ